MSSAAQRGPMNARKQLFFLIATALLLGACTTIPGIVSDAQREFDEGVAVFNAGRYREANPGFQRATNPDPKFWRAYLYLGRSYVSTKNWRQAITPLRAAYRLAPEDTKKEILDILIDALFAGGLDAYGDRDYESAVGYFRELLELQPTSAKARSEFV